MMHTAQIGTIISTKSAPLLKNTTLFDAMAVMKLDQISSVVIVDTANKPLGIFTEHDILKTLKTNDLKTTYVEEVMSKKLFCMQESTGVHDAYMAMEEKNFHHLIVVDAAGGYLGVVSEGDFLRQIGFESLSAEKSLKELVYVAPLLVHEHITIEALAQKMHNAHKEYAIFIEEHLPKALITQRAIAHYLLLPNAKSSDSITEVMHSDFTTLHESSSLMEAGSLMKSHSIHQLIVTNDAGEFVGVVERHALLKEIHGSYFEMLIKTIDNKSSALDELRNIEKQLTKEKEETTKNFLKYQTLFNAIADGCVLLDEDTRALEFNRAMHTMLGYSAEEFAQLRVKDYEFIDTPEVIKKRIEHIVERGSISFETQHIKKDGSIIYVWANVNAVNLEGRTLLMGLFRDMSEFYKQQHELESKSTFLHSTLSAIPDLIWIKDTQGKYLMANPMFERLYNVKEADLLGKDDFDFVSKELATFFQENDKKALMLGGTSVNEEHLVFADGSYEGLFETLKTPMYDKNGATIGVIGIARDISQRKRNDEALNEAQAIAHLGSWRLDITKNTLEWSDETHRIFEIPKGVPLSFETFFNAVHPDDKEKVTKAWSEALQGKPYFVEHRIIVNGKLDWVVNHGRLEFDADANATLAIGTCQLITERKLHEEQLRYLANNDSLTTLANRNSLLTYLKQRVAQSIEKQQIVALLIFDLDRFKDINDSFGHSFGDELLTLIASRLQEHLSQGTLISRLGGDGADADCKW